MARAAGLGLWGLALVALSACSTPQVPASDAPATTAPPALNGAGCGGRTVWLQEGARLLLVNAEGDVQPVHTFGASLGLPEDDVVVNDWHINGGFVGAYAFLNTTPHTYEYLVADAAGAVRFHAVEAAPHNPTVHLSASGELAVAADRGWVVRADGTRVALGPLLPLAAPRDGVVPVSLDSAWSQSVRWGWRSLEDSSNNDVQWVDTVVGGARWAWAGDALVFVQPSGDSGSALLTAHPTRGVQRWALPAGLGWTPVFPAAGDFLLVGSAEPRTLARVNLRTGDVAAVADSGETQGNWDAWSASVNAQGQIWATRTDTTVSPHRMTVRTTRDLGTTWTTVGSPMVQQRDFGAGSRLHLLRGGDNILVLNLAIGFGEFLDEVRLISPSGGFAFTAGGLYLNTVVQAGVADISTDGACSVFLTQSAGEPFAPEAEFTLVFLDANGNASTARTSKRFPTVRLVQ